MTRWMLGFGMVLVLAGAASAAPEAPGPRGEAGLEAQAVSADESGDALSPGTTLVIAYAALWVILMAYVVRLALAQARLRRELVVLQARVDEGAKDPP